MPTQLYFDKQPAIDLFSGDGQLQCTEEYKHIAEWIGMKIKEFRLERMYPLPQMEYAYTWNSRIPDVEFDKSENKKLLSGGWPSLFWHADTYQPENRIKMIILCIMMSFLFRAFHMSLHYRTPPRHCWI